MARLTTSTSFDRTLRTLTSNAPNPSSGAGLIRTARDEINNISNTFIQQSEETLAGYRSDIEASAADFNEIAIGLAESVDSEVITEPLREAVEGSRSDLMNLALRESKIATEQLRALEQNSADPRAAARFQTHRRVQNEITQTIAQANAELNLRFGTAMTEALLGVGQLQVSAAGVISQNAQALLGAMGNYHTLAANLSLGLMEMQSNAIVDLVGVQSNMIMNAERIEAGLYEAELSAAISLRGQDISLEIAELQRKASNPTLSYSERQKLRAEAALLQAQADQIRRGGSGGGVSVPVSAEGGGGGYRPASSPFAGVANGSSGFPSEVERRAKGLPSRTSPYPGALAAENDLLHVKFTGKPTPISGSDMMNSANDRGNLFNIGNTYQGTPATDTSGAV